MISRHADIRARAEVLKQTELFRELDEIVLSSLAEQAVERRLERNEILFIAGEKADGLYIVAKGSVRAFRTNPDGREQVIHVEKAVTTIAEVPVFDNGNFPSTAAADESSVVYFLEREKVRSACIEHPQIALSALRLLASRLRRCAELVENLSLHEVVQRLAMLMLESAVSDGRTGKNGGIQFEQKLTHSQLAARIGTVREVVTRSIYKLQSEGLINITQRSVHIPDIEALRLFAESGRG